MTANKPPAKGMAEILRELTEATKQAEAVMKARGILPPDWSAEKALAEVEQQPRTAQDAFADAFDAALGDTSADNLTRTFLNDNDADNGDKNGA